MKESYLFSDESASYRRPHQPRRGDSVIVRFQTAAADLEHVRVYLIHDGDRREMDFAELVGDLAMFQVRIPVVMDDYSYYFEITERVHGPEYVPGSEDHSFFLSEKKLYYTRIGTTEEPREEDFFAIRPGYQVPDWLPGAVMYQIFTDRFCNGDPANDVLDREYLYLNNQPVRKVGDWESLPETNDVGRFYGGDLQGVWNKLDYLQNLGVQVLYLNPIFISPSNHKYDAQDYDHVDPHLTRIVKDEGDVLPEGVTSNHAASRYRCRVTDPENLEASDRFFADFVAEVHRRGMRIILDGVFNHCGSYHKWLDRAGFYRRDGMPEEEMGAWQSERSRYRSYFNFGTDGNYEAWWGMDTLPKLNYEGSRQLQEDILRIAKKWVSPPYSVDGWRLDVAADLGHSELFNHSFWKRFREVVKAANPDAVILAEHYGDVSPWLKGGEWDTVMNYDAFMEPVTWFLTGMDKHSDTVKPERKGDAKLFLESMRNHMKAFGGASLQGAMNQLDNHDHSRFLTRTNGTAGRLATKGAQAASEGIDKGILRQAVVMQMTWPGAPTLYYGDETGVCGWTDPDNRRTYPWGKEDWDLIDFYKYAIETHKRHLALRIGSLIPLLAEKDVLAYGRCLRHDRIVVIVNTSGEKKTVTVDSKPLGVYGSKPFWRLIATSEEGYNVGLKLVESVDAQITLELEPVSAVILWEK